MTDVKLDKFVVRLSADTHPLEAVKRAAYMLMHRATIAIEPEVAEIVCCLSPVTAEPAQTLERDFRREVLDQDLRLSVEARTAPIRDVILGLAFSRTGLQDG